MTYEEISVSLIADQGQIPDAEIGFELNLYTKDNEDGFVPNLAQITIPACRVASHMVADISYENINRPYVDIVFTLDLSGSMDGDRVDNMVTALSSAINNLFDSYDAGKMRIGIIGFQGNHVYGDVGHSYYNDCSDSHFFDGNSYDFSTIQNYDDPDAAPQYGQYGHDFGDEGMLACLEYMPVTQEYNAQLLSKVSELASKAEHGTPTAHGIELATDLLNAYPDDDVKIIVLMSDGKPEGGHNNYDYPGDVTTAAEDAKSDNIVIFSAAFAGEGCLSRSMERWSSDTCFASGSSCTGQANQGNVSCEPNEETGVEYAYHGNDATSFDTMFETITDAILSATVILSDDADLAQAGVYEYSYLNEGTNQTISLPDDFVCSDSEANYWLQTSFYGIGTVMIDNIKLLYCE